MSDLNHQKDFKTALEHIINLTELPMSYSSDFVRGQIREVAQAALWNAKMSDETFADITSGQMIFQRRLEHLAGHKRS